MPGLLRGVARTAVVAGTASAVAGRVRHRQDAKWAAQEAPPQGYAPQEQYQAAPPQYAPEPPPVDDTTAQLQQLAQLKQQGILTEEEFTAKKKQILGI
ncbi:MAG TPA: SHOCT domain-containing protein [Pyrinomonadaceae bacterium]|nr:SHOCT domain-containing protein [Pyrinomonadaceae bacterium]